MDYRVLGRTGVQVSRLCLGTMAFGSDADEAESGRMFAAALDLGINFLDTADQYSGGRSEEILGRLLAGKRDDLVVASKCFNPTGKDRNAQGGSRRHIVRAAEASLRRLQTDRIDVFYLHKYDPLTPIEESLRALEDLARAGKILHPGVSNYAAWQTQLALGAQERAGWDRLQITQPMYNLVKRQAEAEILPMALANGLSVTPYSPAGGGLLSGKYANKDSAAGRLVANKMYTNRYAEAWAHETAANFAALAKEIDHHPMSVAVAWVAAHPAITAPIIGARSLAQLQASFDSLKVPMTPELRARISALSRTPPPATDRLEEAK